MIEWAHLGKQSDVKLDVVIELFTSVKGSHAGSSGSSSSQVHLREIFLRTF